ncbi:MAG: glycosyltransferase family 2 protein [Clostridia bacterium]|nr:glycosyltransferase family 2 protein [Clostridia bacterium]
MKTEVLVTTMHQTDASKYTEMNLKTDAVIANQSNICAFEEKEIDGKRVRFVTTDTRGLSINRNIAMLYSDADILVFADDDQVFVDGYEEIILKEFRVHPDADGIKFYCESTNPKRPMAYKRPPEFVRAKKKGIMSAGVPGFCIKKTFLQKNNITFNCILGSGAKIICGEDSVFLSELLKHKAKIYLSPTLISLINQGESSWFKGYTEQYFNSIGYVYSCIYGILSPLAIIRRALILKRKKECDLKLYEILRMMMTGRKQHRSK